MDKPASYYAGYEAKAAEIAGMGYEAARDKFNSENPIGHVPASSDGKWFAYGEFDALCGRMR